MPKFHKFLSFLGLQDSYKNVVLYNDLNELKFDKTLDEKWREVSFKDLSPCTTYVFKIEAIYKLPDNYGKATKDILGPNSITAETVCSSTTTEYDEVTLSEDSSDNGQEVVTTEEYISTSPAPPIQPISGVYTQQTVQVLTSNIALKCILSRV